MDEDFEDDGLPQLPAYPALQPQFSHPHIKKRGYSNISDAPHTSSDPPLFSSDDEPEAAGLENYEGQRKKQKHAGPWWRQANGKSRRPASRSARAEGLERNFDSGVWMNSDDTEPSSTEASSGALHDDECQDFDSVDFARQTKTVSNDSSHLPHSLHLPHTSPATCPHLFTSNHLPHTSSVTWLQQSASRRLSNTSLITRSGQSTSRHLPNTSPVTRPRPFTSRISLAMAQRPGSSSESPESTPEYTPGYYGPPLGPPPGFPGFEGYPPRHGGRPISTEFVYVTPGHFPPPLRVRPNSDDGDHDDNKNMFDWSFESRTILSDEDLQPLFTVIRSPKFDDKPPSDDCFEPFTPKIKLFLSHNSLSVLPSRLWDLEHLTVLSLRSNNLAELPSGVAKLANLRGLNVANNKLRYLPWELSRLLRVTGSRMKLILTGNPFLEGTYFDHNAHLELLTTLEAEFHKKPHPDLLAALEAAEDPDQAQSLAWLLKDQEQTLAIHKAQQDAYYTEGADPSDAWKDIRFRFIAATPPALFHADGRHLKGSPPQPSQLPPDCTFLPATVHTVKFGAVGKPLWPELRAPDCSRVPSLLELSLRKALDVMAVEEMAGLAPGIERAVALAAQNRADCGSVLRGCSVCGGGYVVPRAEWVEYFRVDDFEDVTAGFFPFLRRACSFGCVGQRMGWEGEE
ncbi:uncharacterized protein BDZ99DRAFT_502692 [Mytilinidion resinicola]|uniref:L domain-like protein n=1 Tax=Mytilinidion resinicola TaxID=574789 RepID=A0A6A6Y6Y1_9PEZI|nr:uncharacterized protein BDZ99DRAFT_502692 [Mytilinidion resinicola]KAF2804283.1 hypothetical protein BDZ99DRAFT_502692 [Mytilinidion resinicola]